MGEFAWASRLVSELTIDESRSTNLFFLAECYATHEVFKRTAEPQLKYHQTKDVKAKRTVALENIGLSRAVSFLLFSFEFPCMQTDIKIMFLCKSCIK